jgi:hypothetical protein
MFLFTIFDFFLPTYLKNIILNKSYYKMPKCDFCKSDFHDKSTLNKHQRNSKYCIKIQLERDPTKLIEQIIFECDFCHKKLTSKYTLKSHLVICKTKLKQEKDTVAFLEMKEKLQTMEKEVERLKEKPTTTIINSSTTNTNNNYGSILNCLTQQAVQESFKNYSLKDLKATDNQRKLADMTIQNFLTGPENPVYACTDRSRNKFVFTDEENNETEDPNAFILRTLIYRGVKPVIKELYNEQLVFLHSELARSLRKDDAALIAISHEDIKELKDAYAQINILKNGADYISQLSRCLPSSIKDRLIKDRQRERLHLDSGLDSDEEFERQLQLQIRKIGDYTASELARWKKYYKDTGVMKGPKEMWDNPKHKQEFINFLQEDGVVLPVVSKGDSL